MSGTSTPPGPAPARDVETLVAQLAGMAAQILSEGPRDEMVAAMCLLVPWSINPLGRWTGSNLCADGTPVEASLAVGSDGRSQFRFVADVANGIAGDDRSERLGEVTKLCRRFAGGGAASELIGGLAEAHLAGLPPSSRFLAWLGAAAAADSPLGRLFYFNLDGMAQDRLDAILSRYVGDHVASLFRRISQGAGIAFHGAAYDLENGRIAKVQLYHRFSAPEDRSLDDLARVIDHGDLARTVRFCAELFPEDATRPGCPYLVAFGASSPASGAAGRLVPRIYCPLGARGIHDFAGLTPILERLTTRWAIPLRLPDGRAVGFSPTALSLTASASGERIALYFKPDGFSPI